jgi:DNA-directed RNA polymerase subunit RPC12/RpoP
MPVKKSVFPVKPRIEPITCPHCGGRADMMRRTPHPAIKGEIRTFECRQCGKHTEKSAFYP